MLALALSSPVIVPSTMGVYAEPSYGAHAVREPAASYGPSSPGTRYEPEGSEHRILGSIAVSPDAHWTATLTVPVPERQVAFIEVERRGVLPAGYRGSEEAAHLSLPLAEIEAFVALLVGLVAHARHDRALPP